MPQKLYKSIFVPEQQIDAANAVAEIIICNFLVYTKQSLPTCPFWRKEYSANFVELSKRYGLELIGAKQLLKVFGIYTVMTYFATKKRIAFKNLTKPKQMDIIYDLYLLQLKSVDESDKVLSEYFPAIEKEVDPNSIKTFNTNKNKLCL